MYELTGYYEWTPELAKMQSKLTSDISKLYAAIVKQADNYSHSEYISLVKALEATKKASVAVQSIIEFSTKANIILNIPK